MMKHNIHETKRSAFRVPLIRIVVLPVWIVLVGWVKRVRATCVIHHNTS